MISGACQDEFNNTEAEWWGRGDGFEWP